MDPLNTEISSAHRILHALPVLVLEFTVFPDGQRQITFVNDKAEGLLGCSGENLKSGFVEFHQVIYDEDLLSFTEGLNVAVAMKKDWKWEGRIRVGQLVKWVLTLGTHFDYPDGRSSWSVMVTDVSSQKHTELKSRKAETLFAQLFQHAPMAIVFLNDRGTVVNSNRGFEEMFGFAEQELVGKELNQFIVPEGLESEGNDLDTLISSNRVIRLETKRIQKGGRALSVIIYGMPVHLDEETIGIFGLYVDITERIKMEEELKVRNIELDNFVYKVSHDLRAPLSSILGLVNLARHPANDDNLRDYIPLMGQKVKQLDHFISDVLSHSKNLKLEVTTERIDLRKVIEQIFFDLSYLKGADQICRLVNVEGEDFFSDPWRIGEILRNLISNAIKYRKLGVVDPVIEILIQCSVNSAEIVFKDNGIGIQPESLEKIFDMFYRASGQSDGSGLGLYIVKNAVERLGGKVFVESVPDGGTIFKLTLPNQVPGQNRVI